MSQGGDFEIKETCPVCLENLVTLVPLLVSVTECGHQFHRQCLYQWMINVTQESSRRCPVCRHNLQRDRIRNYQMQEQMAVENIVQEIIGIQIRMRLHAELEQNVEGLGTRSVRTNNDQEQQSEDANDQNIEVCEYLEQCIWLSIILVAFVALVFVFRFCLFDEMLNIFVLYY